MVGGQGILTWGSQYLPSGITGLLNSTVPLWIAILALVIFRRRLSHLTIAGLCAGFGGLMLLVAPSLSTGEFKSYWDHGSNIKLGIMGTWFPLLN